MKQVEPGAVLVLLVDPDGVPTVSVVIGVDRFRREFHTKSVHMYTTGCSICDTLCAEDVDPVPVRASGQDVARVEKWAAPWVPPDVAPSQ